MKHWSMAWIVVGLVACGRTTEPPAPASPPAVERSPRVIVVPPTTEPPPATNVDVHRVALTAIAREIEALGATYPALERFRVEQDLHLERAEVLYEHRVKRVVVERGIKRELVVQPESGGIYLHIDFHEDVEREEASAQVFRGHIRNHDRRVKYVALLGDGNGDLGARLWRIMTAHGTVNVGLD